MAYTEVFSGVAVADLEAALAWYEHLMGRPPDLIPNDNEGAWQIVGAGWVYLRNGASRPARSTRFPGR